MSRLIKSFLKQEEIDDLLQQGWEVQKTRFIGGFYYADSGLITLVRPNLSTVVVHRSTFGVSGDGIKPQFSRMKIIDGGATIKFGNYEAASDSI